MFYNAIKLKNITETVNNAACRRLQRTSKVRALDQVKAWCGADDGEPASKKIKKELSSEDDDYSDPDSTKGTLLVHYKFV